MAEEIKEERRQVMHVTHTDFDKFKEALAARLDAQDTQRGEMMDELKTITKALFYLPTNKDDSTPIGIVHTQRKVAKHVDVVCGIWKWFLISIVPILVAIAAIGHDLGLW